MSARYRSFRRSGLSAAEADEVSRVELLAERLVAHIADRTDEIDLVHVHNARSTAVQDIVAQLLEVELGFGQEVVLTPQHGLVTRARPDFFYRLGDDRGILAEVERGGTTTNNHDLKDMWKAHIAPDAQHLFLIVPMINWNESGAPREKPFLRVVQRVASFFGNPRREVDVLSAHVFGYGKES